MPHPSPSPWYGHPNNVSSTNHEAPLQPPVTSFLFRPNTRIVLRNLLLNTANLWSSPAVRDQVSYSYRHQVVHQLHLHNTQFWVARTVKKKKEQTEQHWSDRPALECNQHLTQWGHSLQGVLNCGSTKVSTINASANMLRTTSSKW